MVCLRKSRVDLAQMRHFQAHNWSVYLRKPS
jgi:hypothetical protein